MAESFSFVLQRYNVAYNYSRWCDDTTEYNLLHSACLPNDWLTQMN
jgi:hypothetical protein